MGSKKSIYHSQKTLAIPLGEMPLKSAIATSFLPIRLLPLKCMPRPPPPIGISEGQLSTLSLLFRCS